MTPRQATLALPPPSPAEALRLQEAAMADAAEAADGRWLQALHDAVLALPRNREFITEDVVIALAELGMTAPEKRGSGTVIRSLRVDGYIRWTGEMRSARSSHYGLKPIWRRTSKGKRR